MLLVHNAPTVLGVNVSGRIISWRMLRIWQLSVHWFWIIWSIHWFKLIHNNLETCLYHFRKPLKVTTTNFTRVVFAETINISSTPQTNANKCPDFPFTLCFTLTWIRLFWPMILFFSTCFWKMLECDIRLEIQNGIKRTVQRRTDPSACSVRCFGPDFNLSSKSLSWQPVGV